MTRRIAPARTGLAVEAIDPADMRREPVFYATILSDWTILQLVNGDSFGFNRETGRVYRLPHDECPFVVIGPPKIAQGVTK